MARKSTGIDYMDDTDISGRNLQPVQRLQSRIRKAMEEYVDANLGDVELTSASLQKKFELSRMKMYEILQEDGGTGPFILRRRLIAVMAALCDGELNVTEIMYRFGFSSESQFYRAFRARFDATPKAICMASRRIQERPGSRTVHECRR